MCITEEIKCKNGNLQEPVNIRGYFDDIDVCFLIFLCLCENCREIRQSLIMLECTTYTVQVLYTVQPITVSVSMPPNSESYKNIFLVDEYSVKKPLGNRLRSVNFVDKLKTYPTSTKWTHSGEPFISINYTHFSLWNCLRLHHVQE
jgi:hypothetical protein